MPNQPYIDITGSTAYREATGDGTAISPYVPKFTVGNFPALQAVSMASESGYSSSRTTALTNSPIAVKTSSGFVMGWNFINVNTATVYVKFYNLTVANTTVGTSIPLLTLAVPGGSATIPGIFFQAVDLIPQEVFNTAITIACVTGLADNSTTAPTTPIHASVRYK